MWVGRGTLAVPSLTAPCRLQILSGAIARIYYASPDPAQWSWAGLEGALVFGNTSKGTGGFWFKLVDIVVRLGDYFVL